MIEKSQILFCGHVICDFNGEKIVWPFFQQELQKTNQAEFRFEKVIKGKSDSYMSNEKAMMIPLTAELIIKFYIKWVIFQDHILVVNTKQKLNLNLSNYATKSGLKNAIGLDISDFAKKADLPKLKSDTEKLTIVWRSFCDWKNHTHVKKVGHTSEILLGIYWWTWKTNNY